MTTGSFRDLDLRHLSALVAVADEGTFGKAANALGFTQSAVSQQIASLERIVGLPLFDRPKGPRRAELTPAGELVLDHARLMLSHVSTIDDELDQMRRGVIGTLDIGTFQSVSAQVLPAIIGRMRKEVPNVDFGLIENDSQVELQTMILKDKLDFAFTVDLAESNDFTSIFLGFDPFVLIVADSDPIGEVAKPEDLDGHPLIGEVEGTACQAQIDDRLLKFGARPDYVFRSQDNGAVKGMVRSGMGRALMPMLALDNTNPGLRIVPLDPPIAPRRIALTQRTDRSLIPAAARFTEIAIEVGQQLLLREATSVPSS